MFNLKDFLMVVIDSGIQIKIPNYLYEINLHILLSTFPSRERIKGFVVKS